MSAARTRVLGLLLVLAAITLPGLALTALGHSEAAGVTTLAAIAGLIPMIAAGPRIAVPIVLLLGPASALAVTVSNRPLGAAVLMGGVVVGVGLTSRVHLSNYLTIAPISVLFLIADPPSGPDGQPLPAVLIGVVAVGSALWAAGVGWLLVRHRDRHPAAALGWKRAGGYAAVLGVLSGSATWILVDHQLGHDGAWFVMTLLIILQPSVRDAWDKTLQRAAGTIVGFGLALLTYVVLGRDVGIYLAAAGFIALAVLAWQVWHRPYWQYVALLTPAIVLFEGASTSVVDTAVARLGFTLLAVAVALAVEAIAVAVGRRVA
jgi:hypothetical protein